MGARTGKDVIRRFKESPIELWHRGKRVPDVTAEPGLAGGVAGLAGLYDHQWQHADTMLQDDENGTAKVARSFIIPYTQESLQAIGRAMCRSAEYSMGMMGREPAYLNRVIAALTGGAEYLGQSDVRFGDHIRHYYRYVRDHDLALTHTVLNPRPNRLAGPAHQTNTEIALHVVRERDDGIVVRGARMLATLPMADELLVLPPRLMDNSAASQRYAFCAALPTSTPGLKFICRDSADYGFSAVDHPFGACFEEMDAVVLFDDVLIPWERVFCYRDLDICNNADEITGMLAQMAYQVICKNVIKTEYLLGLASLMVEGAGLESFQHIHEKVTEIWVNLETVKALKHASEADARPNAFGVVTPAWAPLNAARNLYPKLYPRMVEIIQQIGASGLVAMPTAADLSGPLAADIELYYQAARLDASERIPLYRLAWDTAVSTFAGRQVLYERFFFGDPVQMAGATFKGTDRTEYMEKVRAFLQRSQGRA